MKTLSLINTVYIHTHVNEPPIKDHRPDWMVLRRLPLYQFCLRQEKKRATGFTVHTAGVDVLTDNVWKSYARVHLLRVRCFTMLQSAIVLMLKNTGTDYRVDVDEDRNRALPN